MKDKYQGGHVTLSRVKRSRYFVTFLPALLSFTAAFLWQIATPPLRLYSTNCGPRSLGIILQHFRVPIEQSQIDESFSQDHEYISFAEIVEVATKFGLKSEAVTTSFDMIKNERLMGIAPVDEHHFVAVLGTEGNTVLVVDPADDRPRVAHWSACDFVSRWRGAFLILSKPI